VFRARLSARAPQNEEVTLNAGAHIGAHIGPVSCVSCVSWIYTVKHLHSQFVLKSSRFRLGGPRASLSAPLCVGIAGPGGSQMRDRGRASGINARSTRTDPSAKAAIITGAHCSMMALCVACRDGIGDVGSVSPYPVDLLG